jgi:hypothetical protein
VVDAPAMIDPMKGIVSGEIALTWDTKQIEEPPLVSTLYNAFLDCQTVVDGNDHRWRIVHCERIPGFDGTMYVKFDMVPTKCDN